MSPPTYRILYHSLDRPPKSPCAPTSIPTPSPRAMLAGFCASAHGTFFELSPHPLTRSLPPHALTGGVTTM